MWRFAYGLCHSRHAGQSGMPSVCRPARRSLADGKNAAGTLVPARKVLEETISINSHSPGSCTKFKC